jgi:predicted metal-dependent phosphoesterase TrpH
VKQRYYFDLHTHSTDASDDAGATVEGYLKWLNGKRRRGFQVDGIVLTEHRSFDPSVDYTHLGAQYGVTVLKGAELETEIGHVLVYGITPSFAREFDLSRVDLPSLDVFRAAYELGGYAIGAHAGRPRIGIWEYAERGVDLSHVQAIEVLNGGSNDLENDRAALLAEQHGLRVVGGSDAHYVSAIGRCLTAFPRPIGSVDDLVESLRAGDYEPVPIEDTFRGVE